MEFPITVCKSDINTIATSVNASESSNNSMQLSSLVTGVSNTPEDLQKRVYQPLSSFHYPCLLTTNEAFNTVCGPVRKSISTALESKMGRKLDTSIIINLDQEIKCLLDPVCLTAEGEIFWPEVMKARKLINDEENEVGLRDILNNTYFGFCPYLVYSPPSPLNNSVRSLNDICSTVIAKSLDEDQESAFTDQMNLTFSLLHDNISRYTLKTINYNPVLRMNVPENSDPAPLPTCIKDIIKVNSAMDFKTWEMGAYDNSIDVNPDSLYKFISLEYSRHELINSIAHYMGLKKVLTD